MRFVVEHGADDFGKGFPKSGSGWRQFGHGFDHGFDAKRAMRGSLLYSIFGVGASAGFDHEHSRFLGFPTFGLDRRVPLRIVEG